jgi:hypothetical protein
MGKKESFLEREYRLTGIPFKARIATELELQAWVDREKELEKWIKVLDAAVETSTSNFLVFIIGDYGMGKTLSLLKIKEAAANKGLYSIYLNLLSEQRPKNPGLDFILRIVKKIDFDDIKATKKDIIFIKKIFPDTGNTFEKIFFPKNENEKRLALVFVKGEIRPTQSQLKSMEVLRKIDDVDIAKEYLIGLLHVLKSSGFSTLVIALDEFEYLFSLVPKPSQSIYLALLRGLFDLPVQIPERIRDKIANIALFLGISEDGLRRLDELEKVETSTGGPIQPLMRRVTTTVRLEPLSKSYVRMLIEKRLSLNRVKGRYEKEPLIPFTEDFVDYLNELTGGKPSDIIERCDHVLDMGLNKRVPRLTAAFAKEVFEERGYTY